MFETPEALLSDGATVTVAVTVAVETGALTLVLVMAVSSGGKGLTADGDCGEPARLTVALAEFVLTADVEREASKDANTDERTAGIDP